MESNIKRHSVEKLTGKTSFGKSHYIKKAFHWEGFFYN